MCRKVVPVKMMMNPNPLPAVPMGIQSTAGAVPIKNDKGKAILFENLL